ncbi:Histidine ATPase [Fragilaria crotonensis]|nr:Histidine ATPase [Fragilaria crotonensis]
MRALSRQTLENPDTAHCLLHDTSLRLEGQSHFLNQLQEQLSVAAVGGVSGANDNHGYQHEKPKRIIKASNIMVSSSNLLNWKGHLEREQNERKALLQADVLLRNLHVLHHDTFQLTRHLLQSDKIWTTFANNKAHQSTVCATMEQIRSRHATTMETMADLVLLLRPYKLVPIETLTNFLRGRLAVQILCDHYVSLQKGRTNGGLSVDCWLGPVVDEAWTEAKHLCEAHYQSSPEIILQNECSVPVTLIRPWLHHSLVEMFKNAMVASMECAQPSHSNINHKPPPIEVCLQVVQDETGVEFVTIDINDRGGGFTGDPYQFASSPDKWDRLDVQQSYASVRSPLSSLGVGVPSSQWLMQHFGGDLLLRNRGPGYDAGSGGGCTATVKLPLDDDIAEYLPLVDDV